LTYKTKKANISDLPILVALSYNMTEEERDEKDDFIELIQKQRVHLLYLENKPIGYYTIVSVDRGEYLETILIDKKYQGTNAVYKLCEYAVKPENGKPLWGLSRHRRVDILLKKFGFEPKEYETIKGISYRWWINYFQSQ
jgi:hypothetical protein